MTGFHPELRKAISAFEAKNIPLAETLTRKYLQSYPKDPNGLKLLGDVVWSKGALGAAEQLFARCLSLAPDSIVVRYSYARVLATASKVGLAKAELEKLLGADPENLNYQSLMAYTLGQAGEYQEAFRYHEDVLRRLPEQPQAWLVYANDLRAAGRVPESVDALRRVITLDPAFGEAYWNLANLKTFRFSPAEIAAMQYQLTRDGLTQRSRAMLQFALGKALEDNGRYDEAFTCFEKGNALQRVAVSHVADETTRRFREFRETFTRDLFSRCEGLGCSAKSPIFIVGLPRSGSTLIEQILASHSLIEGTRELPHIQAIAARLPGKFQESVRKLDAEELNALGEEYLVETRAFRRLEKPMFIDKMPSNFAYVGFIHLILPNAKIIDIRRHPLDCGMANFKQIFSRAFVFSYSLDDIGRYYRDYVNLMSHFDAALPGRIHRVIYERLVDNPDREVRALLDYIDVPFEQDCLGFHKNTRPVRTASSEQVRMPLFKDSIGSWRKYERYLEPLRRALGPVLTAYPDPPASR